MTLPEGIETRDLLDALYARVEMMEGALRAYRAVVPAILTALDTSQRAKVAALLPAVKADALTALLHPRGTYLRGTAALAKTQSEGFDQEWRQLISSIG